MFKSSLIGKASMVGNFYKCNCWGHFFFTVDMAQLIFSENLPGLDFITQEIYTCTSNILSVCKVGGVAKIKKKYSC